MRLHEEQDEREYEFEPVPVIGQLNTLIGTEVVLYDQFGKRIEKPKRKIGFE